MKLLMKVVEQGSVAKFRGDRGHSAGDRRSADARRIIFMGFVFSSYSVALPRQLNQEGQ